VQVIYVSGFVLFNIAYMWVRQDAEMERRAAPTTALMQELRKYPPQHAMILNFPYPYPEIAKGASELVPGWQADLVELGGVGSRCSDCLLLEWDSGTRAYRRLAAADAISRPSYDH